MLDEDTDMAKPNQSTDKIMRALIKKHGHIALSLTIRLKDPKTGQYGHYRGGSVNVQADNPEDAIAFAENLKKHAIKTARDMGLTLPGLVVVDA
jgi:hypothetical protein